MTIIKQLIAIALLLTATLDVSDREAVATFAAKVHAKVPALDVLINNAGVGSAGTLWETPLDEWERVLAINLRGVLYGCHAFVPNMISAGRGQVVNLSSLLGYFGAPGVSAYVASKFAVLGLSESLRAELKPHGVGVTTICPGMINTAIVREGRFCGLAEGERDRIAETFATRGARPERVAKAIVRAVRRNRGLVTVTPEAWALRALKRLSPGLCAWLSGRVTQRLAGTSVSS